MRELKAPPKRVLAMVRSYQRGSLRFTARLPTAMDDCTLPGRWTNQPRHQEVHERHQDRARGNDQPWEVHLRHQAGAADDALAGGRERVGSGEPGGWASAAAGRR